MLTRDAMLAWVHFLCIFSLASLLACEIALLRAALPAGALRRLQSLDRWYGIVAGLVIASGLARLFLGPKGPAFYAHNPVFWTKMALFVIVALISIAPTLTFIRWSARAASDGSLQLEAAEFTRVRTLLWVQVAVFAFIPLCAALMARGIGLGT